MPESRCRYEYDVDTVEGHGAAACWRPVWDGRDRCVWHANEAQKPRAVLEEHRPEPGERLDGAILRGVSLSNVRWLRESHLVTADFTDATLTGADLSGADLRRATFRDVNAHGASFERANVEDAVFAFADLRGADFRDTRLYRAVFTDVRVNNDTDFGESVVYEADFEEGADGGDPLAVVESATWTYREIQRIFEENANPRRVQRYFLREMDLRRRAAWRRRNYLAILRAEGARWIMRYGISPWRVMAASALLILVCGLLFPVTGGIVETGDGSPITYAIYDPADPHPPWAGRVFLKSLYFSVVTFATLGYGDIQPVGGVARAIAGVESLFGSLLLALLVFVLTWRIR
ncbi:MAG: pentapeptide repeat-containing protein [Halosimplex sp.]